MRAFQLFFDFSKTRCHVIFIGVNQVCFQKHESFARYVNYYKNYLYIYLHSIRMGGKNINFDDVKIKKSNFYKSKKKLI